MKGREMTTREIVLNHDIHTLRRLIREYPMRTMENVAENLIARLMEEGGEQ